MSMGYTLVTFCLFYLQIDAENRVEMARRNRPLKIESKVQQYLWIALQTAVYEAAKFVQLDPHCSASNSVVYTFVDISREYQRRRDPNVVKMSLEHFELLCKRIWSHSLTETINTKDKQSQKSTFFFKTKDAEEAFQAHLSAIRKVFDDQRIGRCIARIFVPFTQNAAYDQAAGKAQSAAIFLGQMLASAHKFYRDKDVLSPNFVKYCLDNSTVTGGAKGNAENKVFSYIENVDKIDNVTPRRGHPEDIHEQKVVVNLEYLEKLYKLEANYPDASRDKKLELGILAEQHGFQIEDYMFRMIDLGVEKELDHRWRCKTLRPPQKEQTPDVLTRCGHVVGEGKGEVHSIKEICPQCRSTLPTPAQHHMKKTLQYAAMNVTPLQPGLVCTFDNEEIGVHVLQAYPVVRRKDSKGEHTLLVTAEEYKEMREPLDFAAGEAWQFEIYLREHGLPGQRWPDCQFIQKVEVESTYQPKYSLHPVHNINVRKRVDEDLVQLSTEEHEIFKNKRKFPNLARKCPAQRVNTVHRSRVRCGFGAGPRPQPYRPWVSGVKQKKGAKEFRDGLYKGQLTKEMVQKGIKEPKDLYVGKYQEHMSRLDEDLFPQLKQEPLIDGRLKRFLLSVLGGVDFLAGSTHHIFSERFLRNEEISNRQNQDRKKHPTWKHGVHSDTFAENRNWVPIPNDMVVADLKAQASERTRFEHGAKFECDEVKKLDHQVSATIGWQQRAHRDKLACRAVASCFSTCRDPYTRTGMRPPLVTEMKRLRIANPDLRDPQLTATAWSNTRTGLESSLHVKDFATVNLREKFEKSGPPQAVQPPPLEDKNSNNATNSNNANDGEDDVSMSPAKKQKPNPEPDVEEEASGSDQASGSNEAMPSSVDKQMEVDSDPQDLAGAGGSSDIPVIEDTQETLVGMIRAGRAGSSRAGATNSPRSVKRGNNVAGYKQTFFEKYCKEEPCNRSSLEPEPWELFGKDKSKATALMTLDYDLASNWADTKPEDFVNTGPPKPKGLLDFSIVHAKGDPLEPDGMSWPARFMGMSKQRNSEAAEKGPEGGNLWFFLPEGFWRTGEQNRSMALTLLGEDDSENEDEEQEDTVRLAAMANKDADYLRDSLAHENKTSGTTARCFSPSGQLLSRATPVLSKENTAISQRAREYVTAENLKKAREEGEEEIPEEPQASDVEAWKAKIPTLLDFRTSPRVFFSADAAIANDEDRKTVTREDLRESTRNPYHAEHNGMKFEYKAPNNPKYPKRSTSPDRNDPPGSAGSVRQALRNVQDFLEKEETADKQHKTNVKPSGQHVDLLSTRQELFTDALKWFRRLAVTPHELGPEARTAVFNKAFQCLELFERTVEDLRKVQSRDLGSVGNPSGSDLPPKPTPPESVKSADTLESSEFDLLKIRDFARKNSSEIEWLNQRSTYIGKIMNIVLGAVDRLIAADTKGRDQMSRAFRVISKAELEEIYFKMEKWQLQIAGILPNLKVWAKLDHLKPCFQPVPWAPQLDGDRESWGVTSYQVDRNDMRGSAQNMTKVPDQDLDTSLPRPGLEKCFLVEHCGGRYGSDWVSYLASVLGEAPLLRESPWGEAGHTATNMACNLMDFLTEMQGDPWQSHLLDNIIRKEVMERCGYLSNHWAEYLGPDATGRFKAVVGAITIEEARSQEYQRYRQVIPLDSSDEAEYDDTFEETFDESVSDAEYSSGSEYVD